MVWYGMVVCGVVWCCIGWYGVVWCGMVCMVRYGGVWWGTVRCRVVWCGMVCYGVAWCCMVWSVIVWKRSQRYAKGGKQRAEVDTSIPSVAADSATSCADPKMDPIEDGFHVASFDSVGVGVGVG